VFLIGPIGRFPVDAVRAQQPPEKSEEASRVGEATAILSDVLSAGDQAIPREILDKAVAIAVLPHGPRPLGRRGRGPNERKAALMRGVRARGIMSVRGESGWLAPAFVTLNGGSPPVGDVILVVMNRDAVDRVLGNAFKIGSNVAAGPMGEDAKAQTSGAAAPDIFSYTRSRGTVGGATLDAAMVLHDDDATRRFYGKPLTGVQAVAQASGPEPVAGWRAALEKHTRK
jgi:lipid-binding SYLF domain-containing protein